MMALLDSVNSEQSVKHTNQVERDNCRQQTKQHHEGEKEEDAIDLKLVEELREMLKNHVKLEHAENGIIKIDENLSQIHYEEIMDPKSPYVCWRYLKHCKLRLEESIKLIMKALIYHKENVDDHLDCKLYFKELWHKSTFTFCGVDKRGNDVVHVNKKDHKKPDAVTHEIAVSYCKAMIFRWDKKNRYSLKKAAFVIDVRGAGYRNMDLPFTSWIIGILDYIPSRVDGIYFVGTPLIVRPIVRMIVSWLPDNYTSVSHLCSFEELVSNNIDLDQLPVEAGGSYEMRKYRVAPKESPWRKDTELYSSDKIGKAFHSYIGYTFTDEKRKLLREMQLEHDAGTVEQSGD